MEEEEEGRSSNPPPGVSVDSYGLPLPSQGPRNTSPAHSVLLTPPPRSPFPATVPGPSQPTSFWSAPPPHVNVFHSDSDLSPTLSPPPYHFLPMGEPLTPRGESGGAIQRVETETEPGDDIQSREPLMPTVDSQPSNSTGKGRVKKV